MLVKDYINSAGYITYCGRQYGIKRTRDKDGAVSYQVGTGMKASPIYYAILNCNLDAVLTLMKHGIAPYYASDTLPKSFTDLFNKPNHLSRVVSKPVGSMGKVSKVSSININHLVPKGGSNTLPSPVLFASQLGYNSVLVTIYKYMETQVIPSYIKAKEGVLHLEEEYAKHYEEFSKVSVALPYLN